MIILGKVKGTNPCVLWLQWCSLQREHVKESVSIKCLGPEQIYIFILVSLTLKQEFITNQKLSLFSQSSKHYATLPKQRYLATNLLLLREILENIKGFPPLVSTSLLPREPTYLYKNMHIVSRIRVSHMRLIYFFFYDTEINVCVIKIQKPKSPESRYQ